MRSTSLNRIRKEIAHEAAKLLAIDGLANYLQAKKKAAVHLGITDKNLLPSNSEIEIALIEYQSLFQNKKQSQNLSAMRSIAHKTMQLLEPFTPLLVGSVLNGTAHQYSEITLHAFSDTAELVGLFLQNKSIPASLCERRLQLIRNKPVYFTAFKFLAGEFSIIVIVLPENSKNIAPIDPVDGKPMKRANTNDVKKLV